MRISDVLRGKGSNVVTVEPSTDVRTLLTRASGLTDGGVLLSMLLGRRSRLAHDLALALERDELWVAYQPVVGVAIVGQRHVDRAVGAGRHGRAHIRGGDRRCPRCCPACREGDDGGGQRNPGQW